MFYNFTDSKIIPDLPIAVTESHAKQGIVDNFISIALFVTLYLL